MAKNSEDEFDDIELDSKQDRLKVNQRKQFQKIEDSIIAYKEPKDLAKVLGVIFEQTSEFYNESKENNLTNDQIKKKFQDKLLPTIKKSIDKKSNSIDRESLSKISRGLEEGLDVYVKTLEEEHKKSSNKFTKLGKVLQQEDGANLDNSLWKKVGDFCKKFSDRLANHCYKKDEEFKNKSLKESLDNISKKLNKDGLITNSLSSSSNITPLAKNTSVGKNKTR